ncbi:MAG: diguanylate cyclase domain-containing protein [Pseudobdellovibrio sp.]
MCLANNTNCSPNKLPQALQLKIQACELTTASPACQNMIKAEPEFTFSLKRCKPNDFCKDYLWKEFDTLKGCGSGFLIGTGENMTNIYESISKWWDNAKTDMTQKKNFLTACDKSLACRKELIKNVQKYQKHSNEKLMQEPILALFAAKNSQETWGDLKLKTPREILEMKKRGEDPNTAYKSSGDLAIINAAKEWLSQKAVRLECVDRRTQAELTCWAAAYILDPLVVAGASAKATRGASKIFSSLIKKIEIQGGATGSRKFTLFERRINEPKIIAGTELIGKRLETLKILPNLPNSISLARYKGLDGTDKIVMEKAVRTSSGDIKTIVREVQIDPLTGAIDANNPTGKYLLESVLKENNGKSTLAFIDVNNLGYVNKNFSAGTQAGDEYLKNVAAAVKKATNNQAQLYKLGGDEFGLVIKETDPEKVQNILNKVIKEVYSKDVHSTFRNEKILQAKAFKDANNISSMTNEQKKLFASAYKENQQQSLAQFAPYSQQGVSIGSTRVGNGESLETALLRAEAQAKNMKITTKENLNIDASKYGGHAPDPSKKSNLTYMPEAQKPISGQDITKSFTPSPSLSSSKGLAHETRRDEIYRIGEVSAVQYTNAEGQSVLRYEKYTSHKLISVKELTLNETTRLIDVSKGSGADFANAVIHTKDNKNSVVWVNAENLGKINYFEKGTAAGDNLLEATGNAITKVLGNSGIPFKGQGSEFAIAVSNMTPVEIEVLNKKLSQALLKDPKVHQIFKEQKSLLVKKLQQPNLTQNQKISIKRQLDELKSINPAFTIRSLYNVPADKNLNQIINQLKAK